MCPPGARYCLGFAVVEAPVETARHDERVVELLREVVEELAPLERRAGSPGEAQAAEWLAARLGELGADARVEEVPFRDGYAWLMMPLGTSATIAGLLALSGRARRHVRQRRDRRRHRADADRAGRQRQSLRRRRAGGARTAPRRAARRGAARRARLLRRAWQAHEPTKSRGSCAAIGEGLTPQLEDALRRNWRSEFGRRLYRLRSDDFISGWI